jgi:hypothetical protein
MAGPVIGGGNYLGSGNRIYKRGKENNHPIGSLVGSLPVLFTFRQQLCCLSCSKAATRISKEL